jgi:metacaspase-1
MSGYSLHIGLDHVSTDAYSGWDGRLSVCSDDMDAMARIAEDRGFAVRRVMGDRHATRGAVFEALAEMARCAVAGDAVLVTFSGQGGQVPDLTSDECDGGDDSWCLWDGQILEDEIRASLLQFARGVRVVVISDTCHAGTLVRSFVPCSAARDRARHMPQEIAYATYIRHREMYDSARAHVAGVRHHEPCASVLALAGCQDNQAAVDGAFNGAFTAVLLRVWRHGGFEGDWRQFHRKIVAEMPPSQTPRLSTSGGHWPAFLLQPPFTVAAPPFPQPVPIVMSVPKE